MLEGRQTKTNREPVIHSFFSNIKKNSIWESPNTQHMRASCVNKWNEFSVISSFLFFSAHVRFSNGIVKILPYFSCVYFSIVWYKLFKSLKLRQFGKSRNDRFSVCLSLCLSLPTNIRATKLTHHFICNFKSKGGSKSKV